jgi:ABC-type Fe3+/spermidine/putrescine transport system ATPase subunit
MKPYARPAGWDEPAKRPGSHARPLARGGIMAARISASGPAAAGTACRDVALRAVGLTKRFGRVVALDGLDLEVGAGEVHAFLGPNGAGKTTMIRILLGLLKADAGEATLLGADPWCDAVELHRRLAYVPGDLTLWPSLTGGEIIDLLGRLRGGVASPAVPLPRSLHRDSAALPRRRSLALRQDRLEVFPLRSCPSPGQTIEAHPPGH